jgi:hypothetical protein
MMNLPAGRPSPSPIGCSSLITDYWFLLTVQRLLFKKPRLFFLALQFRP